MIDDRWKFHYDCREKDDGRNRSDRDLFSYRVFQRLSMTLL